MLLKLLSLPLTAPVHATVWLAGEIHGAAERELNDPARLRAELTQLERALEAGEIDETTFEEREEVLIIALQAARRGET